MDNFQRAVRDFIHEWTLNILILLFESTVLIGDHMLVDKLAYAPPGIIGRYLLPYREPQRGDVIVFRYPLDIRQNYVKRLMGMPGDRIHVLNKVLYVNGKPLTEPYTQHIFPDLEPYRDTFPMAPNDAKPLIERNVPPERALEMLTHVQNGELVVPEGSYFAMGDNRDNSLDSRYWGFVPRDYIIGKPLLIFWSYDAPTEQLVGDSGSHYLDLLQNFFSKTRWNRTLKLVRGIPIN